MKKWFERSRYNIEIFTVLCGGKIHNYSFLTAQTRDIDGVVYKDSILDAAQSDHIVKLPSPGLIFQGTFSISPRYNSSDSTAFFIVEVNGQEVCRVRNRIGEPGIPFRISLNGCTEFRLRCERESGRKEVNVILSELSVTLENGESLIPGKKMEEAAVLSLLPRFRYNGREFNGGAWENSWEEMNSEDSRVRLFCRTFLSPDRLLSLKLMLRFYPEENAVECVPFLENTGDSPSGLIEDFQALSVKASLGKEIRVFGNETRVAVHANLGSKALNSDFESREFLLSARPGCNMVHFDTDEARSSATWLPFFRIEAEKKLSFLAAIGWSGAWSADANCSWNEFAFTAGMTETRFRVMPGEKLRQVSSLLMFTGEQSRTDAQNAFRRFLLEFHSPRDSRGHLIRPPFSFMVWGGMPTASMLSRIRMIRENNLPFQTFWMDAGWYGDDEKNVDVFSGDWYAEAGKWQINRKIHPEGLRPVSDAAHEAGMKTLLWFEPERAFADCPVVREHPEWFLCEAEAAANRLLDLGNSEAREWALETVSKVLREESIDYYRQDFNLNPKEIFTHSDPPERSGVSEMKYMEGLYLFLDALRVRFPNMLIDNCASGGRRLDFEMMKRSLPLWRSDLQCNLQFACEANQTETFYLTQWLPFHAGGVRFEPGDDYNFFSGIAAGVSCCIFDCEYLPPADGYPFDWLKSRIRHALRIAPCFAGDFYSLSEAPEKTGNWVAFQLHCGNEGVLLAFRRKESAEEKFTLVLHGIQAECVYELEDMNGGIRKVAGRELQSLPIFQAPRSCFLCYYRISENDSIQRK